MAEQPVLQPRFQPGYGSNCHMKESGYIPVCVVTDLRNNILIKNMVTDVNKIEWLVSRCRVSLNRFWTSSNAVIRCTISSENLSEGFPAIYDGKELAGLFNQRSGPAPTAAAPAAPVTAPAQPLRTRAGTAAQRKKEAEEEAQKRAEARVSKMQNKTQNVKGPLNILDEICIYLGYIDSLRPVTKEDISSGRLRRVFVGVIDTITTTGTNRDGTSLMIQCRDRMRYLMDSLGTFNTADSVSLDVPLELDEDSTPTNTRSDVILTIARRSVGDLRNASSISQPNAQAACNFVGGVGIDPGLMIDFSGSSTEGITQEYEGEPTKFSNLNPYVPYLPEFGQDLRGGSLPISLSGSLKSQKEFPTSILKFNIITGRPGYQKEDLVSNFQVTDRVPVEYIKYLSLQEPWPTELFCHHQSGEYWYVPRGTDVSGFEDSERYFRTYFYRRYPRDLKLKQSPAPPHIAQMCLNFREERSALGWRSNIIISSGARSATGNQGETTDVKSGVHISITPPWLKGRVTPTSYYTAVDPTASTVATLGSMAISFARNLGKETKVATARFLGDPTFSPGEALQIMGSPLNTDPITDKQRRDDVALATSLRDSYRDLSLFLSEKIKDAKGAEDSLEITESQKALKPTTINKANSDVITSTSLMCPTLYGPLPAEGNENTALPRQGDIEFVEEPKSIWRSEGITHYYNDGEVGYFTEVSLLSAF